MQLQLTTKNVAPSTAQAICEVVEKQLLGKKVGTLIGVKRAVRHNNSSSHQAFRDISNKPRSFFVLYYCTKNVIVFFFEFVYSLSVQRSNA